jgi:hypothetical protein
MQEHWSSAASCFFRWMRPDSAALKQSGTMVSTFG